MDKRTRLRVLKRARGYIAAPERWCQGNLVTQDGRHCAIGAVVAAIVDRPYDPKVDGWDYTDDVRPVLETLSAQIPARSRTRPTPWGNVASYNNTRTHKQVLSLFDKAIAKESGK